PLGFRPVAGFEIYRGKRRHALGRLVLARAPGSTSCSDPYAVHATAEQRAVGIVAADLIVSRQYLFETVRKALPMGTPVALPHFRLNINSSRELTHTRPSNTRVSGADGVVAQHMIRRAHLVWAWLRGCADSRLTRVRCRPSTLSCTSTRRDGKERPPQAQK